MWSPSDLERFTELYRSDHANELQESQAHEALTKAEKEAEEAGARLSEWILKRYHEEQIWSDKIRRMSTWGTWGLMGVNVLLFLVFQIGVEPWRRRRLVKGFEDKVMEALEREKGVAVVETGTREDVSVQLPMEAEREVDESAGKREGGVEAVDQRLERNVDVEVEEEVAASVDEETLTEQQAEEILASRGLAFEAQRLRDVFSDLFSDRQISVQKWHLTALALQGAVAGMTVAGLIVAVLR